MSIVGAIGLAFFIRSQNFTRARSHRSLPPSSRKIAGCVLSALFEDFEHPRWRSIRLQRCSEVSTLPLIGGPKDGRKQVVSSGIGLSPTHLSRNGLVRCVPALLNPEISSALRSMRSALKFGARTQWTILATSAEGKSCVAGSRLHSSLRSSGLPIEPFAG